MAKKTKIPTVHIPPKPEPPPTREQTEANLLRYLKVQIEIHSQTCADWKARIAAGIEPQRIVYDLEWSLSFFQAASKLMAYSLVFNNLKDQKDTTKATVESVYSYVLQKTVDGARFGYQSTSITSNLSAQCTLQAWAEIAESLEGWVKSLKVSDEYYAKQEAAVVEAVG